MKLTKSKKGQVVDQLGALAVMLGVIGITLVVAFLIFDGVRDNAKVAADANATAAINSATNAASDIPGWLPIIVITIIGSLLIGLIAVFRR